MGRIHLHSLGLSIASDWYVVGIFFTVVTGNILMYLLTVAPWILTDSSPFFPDVVMLWWLPTVIAVLADFFLFATLLIDPGIVKKRGGSPAVAPAANNVAPTGYLQSGGMHMPSHRTTNAGLHTQSPTPSSEPVSEGRSIGVAPPEEQDVHMCPVCQVYVEMFDHHCGIIGACIGRFNMGTFILFLTFACLLCVFGTPPAFYTLYLKLRGFNLAKSSYFFLDPSVIFNMLVICSGCIGGSYTFYLGFHYTITAWQGKNSLYLRRRWIREHWEELDQHERMGQMPVSHYFHKGNFYNLKLVLREMRFRLAPIYPEREM